MHSKRGILSASCVSQNQSAKVVCFFYLESLLRARNWKQNWCAEIKFMDSMAINSVYGNGKGSKSVFKREWKSFVKESR